MSHTTKERSEGGDITASKVDIGTTVIGMKGARERPV